MSTMAMLHCVLRVPPYRAALNNRSPQCRLAPPSRLARVALLAVDDVLNGGTRITIAGEGFARNQFNYGQGQENVGNNVTLVSDTRSYLCDMHKDGTHEKQITCYTRPMKAATYYVRVSVDGAQLAMADYWTTVTVYGKIFTAYFSSTILTANSTNGITAKLLRTYMGGVNCEVLDELGNVKELVLDGKYGEKPTGHFKCSIDSKYIEVTEVTPSSGGTEGGTFLHIHGTGLDDTTDAATQVLVGGAVCDIQSVTADEIVCLTPKPLNSNTTSFEGNRGWRLEIWDLSKTLNSNDLDEIAAMNETLDGYSVSYIEEAKYVYSTQKHVARLSGYFVAPDSGKFAFFIKGKYAAKMYFTAQNNRTEIARFTTRKNDWQRAEVVTLNKGNRYFVEIFVSSTSRKDSEIEVGVHRSNAPYNAAQTAWGRDEKQTITTSTDIQPEIQEIDLSGWPATQASTQEVQIISIVAMDTTSRFRVGLSGVYTNWLTVAMSAKDLAKEVSSLVTVQPDTVSIKKEQDGNTYKFTVTFKSDRGLWPLLSIMSSEDSDLNVNVLQDTRGVPSYKTVTFTYNGIKAPPVKVDAEAAEVESSINSILSVKCPDSIIKPPEDTTYLMRDYEDEFTGQYYEHGDRVKSEEAFCGHTSLRSGHSIKLFDKPVRLNSHPWDSVDELFFRQCVGDIKDVLSSYIVKQIFLSCMMIPLTTT
ncbi:hypothetical protein NP493_419g08002 [Ridgeia piscesae]|uniref:PA14 domain-containing protein n=1 Tax=Ridgeia piscesae TaxID=27915 RepID=A0AAD9NVD4_RIDPI|nr:hypothetical protein NP493_419g08002 [Ridgeia piscesae]